MICSIDVCPEDDVVILYLKGRLDALSAQDLKNIVKKSVNSNNRFFIIDLSEIDFIDSSGLGSLISSLRFVTRVGGDIFISNPNKSIKYILDITRLTKVFNIFNSIQDALKYFSFFKNVGG